jgi:hypothetical protein
LTGLLVGGSLACPNRLVAEEVGINPAVSGTDAAALAPALAIYPPRIQLESARDYQSFISTIRRPDGVTLDTTDQGSWELSDPAIARIEGNRLLPLADGQGELIYRYAGAESRVPVVVSGAATRPPITFTRDVIPAFTRAGCNTGSCHGAARGKDGFRLSLFGFDPQGDYHRVTREQAVRRLNLALPAESLLLQKAVGSVPHTGGKRLDPLDPLYADIIEWIAAGALADPGPAPVVESLSIYPPQAVIAGEGQTQRFIAVAQYADGTTRDVSGLATFQSNNATSASIDGVGRAIAGARGEAFVMARFDTHTVGSQVIVLPGDVAVEPSPPPRNYIDEHVYRKLQLLRIPPSGTCDDNTFLRRVTLDIVGLLPTEQEYQQFRADVAPDKRSRVIDQLLERKEFSEIWAMRLAQLLMIKSSNEVSYKAAFLYNQWLTDCFARQVPLDQIVRDLLGATGGTFKNPATNFYQVERDTLKTAENVAQVFMGIRTQCAQCHNHPFDRWTMDDYYGFAAFFSQVGRKQAEDYRELIVFNAGGGEVSHPIGGRVMAPKFLGAAAPDLQGRDRRTVLAEWLTSPENPYFSQSIANRVWASLMGSGLVEPVDDIRVSNPSSNPELMAELGRKLVEYRFDLRQLVRDICNSDAYQRSAMSRPENATDTRNYAFATVRRIPAEHLLDCISQVTETKAKFRGLPLGARAVQIADGQTSNYFLDTFGRARRATVCACEASTDPSLSQALHLLNGESIQQNIANGGVVARWLSEGLTQEAIIDRIFERGLGRPPTDEERKELIVNMSASSDPRQGLEDVMWAVLNSREFIFNH